MWSIANKEDMARNLDRMSRLLPHYYYSYPKTFLIPSQTGYFEKYFYQQQKNNKQTFIVKPDKGCQSKGIILIQDPEYLYDYFESAVCQEYISPFLID